MGSFTKVAQIKDIPEGKSACIELNRKMIAIFNVSGKFYAIDDPCTHASGPLSDGELNGSIVTCPWHGATFDVTSGKVLSGPAGEDVKSYQVQVKGEDILLEE